MDTQNIQHMLRIRTHLIDKKIFGEKKKLKKI